MKPWYVYVLLNDENITYTGIAIDLDARLAQHNSNTGAKFTRGRGPWSIAYTERYATKGDALRREAQIKSDRKFKILIKQ